MSATPRFTEADMTLRLCLDNGPALTPGHRWLGGICTRCKNAEADFLALVLQADIEAHEDESPDLPTSHGRMTYSEVRDA